MPYGKVSEKWRVTRVRPLTVLSRMGLGAWHFTCSAEGIGVMTDFTISHKGFLHSDEFRPTGQGRNSETRLTAM